MSILKKVFWKNMPLDKTQLLQSLKKSSIEFSTKLSPFIQTTLENGEFVSMGIPKKEEDLKAPLNENPLSDGKFFLHPHSETWASARNSLSNNVLQINELSKKPDVNLIQLHNTSNAPIFFPSGTVFLGGSQNRVLLEPKLIRKGKTIIPVFCIEAGRWDDPTPFKNINHLPDLLSCKFSDVSGGSLDRQIKYWEIILESLSLLKIENKNMNAMSMLDDISMKGQAIGKMAIDVPDKTRGYYAPDPKTGITILRLTPGADHFKESLLSWGMEKKWRSRFRKFAPAARLYFRVFDEEKTLAIKCHPDGKPYKTIRGKVDAFYYTPDDLKNSYIPPIDVPPPERPLNFEKSHSTLSSFDFCNVLQECEATVTKAGSNLIALQFRHPELPLVGNALLHKGKVSTLDAMYFESDLSK